MISGRLAALAALGGAGAALLGGGPLAASAHRAGGRPSPRPVDRACRAAHRSAAGAVRRGRRACVRRLGPPPAPVSPLPSGLGPARATASAVGVHEHEFRISLTRNEVIGGRVLVELDNEGQDPHDLQIARVGPGPQPVDSGAAAADAALSPQVSFPTLSAGRRQTQTVTLGPGVWRLWCSLPGHDAAGMHALLRVVG
ncbi:MAG TPA: hypothetical protein VGY97_12975 [Solirubrobacteraceae bacterium]|nr:hypothetical protein [Solirubrobacteraceae bacterium]